MKSFLPGMATRERRVLYENRRPFWPPARNVSFSTTQYARRLNKGFRHQPSLVELRRSSLRGRIANLRSNRSIKQRLDAHPCRFRRVAIMIGFRIEGSKACSLDWRMRRKGLYGIY